MDTTTPDLRRPCHCGRNGIGPHWYSRQEGCPHEPVETVDDRPALAIPGTGTLTLYPSAGTGRDLECDRCARLQTTIEELADLVARLRREQPTAAPEQPTAGPERECGHEFNGSANRLLRCIRPGGHEAPHNNSNGTSWMPGRKRDES